MGIDDHIYEIVQHFAKVELAGLDRSKRETEWQDLIRYVDELIRTHVRLIEEDLSKETLSIDGISDE